MAIDVDSKTVGTVRVLPVIHVYFLYVYNMTILVLIHLEYINNLFIFNKKQTPPHYSLIKTSASFSVDSGDVLLCGDKSEVMRSFAQQT